MTQRIVPSISPNYSNASSKRVTIRLCSVQRGSWVRGVDMRPAHPRLTITCLLSIPRHCHPWRTIFATWRPHLPLQKHRETRTRGWGRADRKWVLAKRASRTWRKRQAEEDNPRDPISGRPLAQVMRAKQLQAKPAVRRITNGYKQTQSILLPPQHKTRGEVRVQVLREPIGQDQRIGEFREWSQLAG